MPYDRNYFDEYHKVPSYRLIYPDENVIRFLASNFPAARRKSKKILDLGCGCGRHLILLKELGFQAYGIDGSPAAVRYARAWLGRRRFSPNVRVGLIMELPYRDDFFDGIVEHATLVNNDWKDILKGCEEAHRVLKPGGIGFFLLKKITDCAFDRARKVEKNTYLVDEGIFMSRAARSGKHLLQFRAFSRSDIRTMFHRFKTVRVHTWDTSFKGLNAGDRPGERLTSYWIVVVQK